MERAVKIFVAISAILIILGFTASIHCSKPIFYVYGSMACLSCEKFSAELKKSFGEDSIVFREIDQNPENLDQMVSIYEVAFPELKKSELVIPLTIVVVDGEIRGVISGEVSMDLVKEVIESSQNLTLIYPDGRIIRGNYPELSNLIRDIIFKGATQEKKYSSISQVILPILGAAAADSVNPCTFSVFTALLLMSMFFRGRGGMVKVGAAFISAIYLAYYLLGLGLVKVFAAFIWLRYAIAVAGIVLGSYEISTSLKRGFRSPLPKPLYKFTSNLVDRVSTKPAAPLAFGMGLIVSFTLLPCSAGPYLVALSLIAGLSDFERYAALAIYNLVFVVPLVFILISLGIAAQVSSKIKKFRSEKMTLLNLISASLLILICIWALFQ